MNFSANLGRQQQDMQVHTLDLLSMVWVLQMPYTAEKGPMALATSLLPWDRDMTHALNTCGGALRQNVQLLLDAAWIRELQLSEPESVVPRLHGVWGFSSLFPSRPLCKFKG